MAQTTFLHLFLFLVISNVNFYDRHLVVVNKYCTVALKELENIQIKFANTKLYNAIVYNFASIRNVCVSWEWGAFRLFLIYIQRIPNPRINIITLTI